ncbi:hypothetical protein VNI00_009461 [Paramarasmius palmivorus]|uniref:Uncharacterized protein n=1 Tax=Paramarasmius palmivorus TaxID=297713 RepID=A0AAW0CS93_9AGAR
MHYARDSGIALSTQEVVSPTTIPFPTPDFEKPTLPPKDTYKKPPKYHYDDFDLSRDTVEESLSNVPSPALVKRLLKDDSVNKKTRQLLVATVSRLESASQRAAEAEAAKRAIESKALLEKARLSSDAALAKDEAQRMKLELEMYRLKLQQAEDEVRRARESVKVLDDRRNEAERAAIRARNAARKYRGENMVILAREQGRNEGYRQGLTMGREAAFARLKELDGGDYDDYFSPEIVGDGYAYIEEYDEGDEGAAYSSRAGSNYPRDRKRDEHHQSRSRHHSMTSKAASNKREAESSRRRSNSRPAHSEHQDPESRSRRSHLSRRNVERTPVVDATPEITSTPRSTQQAPPVPLPSSAPSSPALPIPPPRPSQVGQTDGDFDQRSESAGSVHSASHPVPFPVQQDHSPAPSPSMQPPSQPTPNSAYAQSPQYSAGAGASQPLQAEPEDIMVREPVHSSPHYTAPPTPASQSHSSPQPPIQPPFSQPPINSPQQPSDTSLADSGILEYVPMPAPPFALPPDPPVQAPLQTSVPPSSQAVQAPIPHVSSIASSRTEERAREREAEVSTPSTMTGITAIPGLRSFPAAPVPPSSAGSAEAGVPPGYTGSNGSSNFSGRGGGADYGFGGRGGGLSTIYEQSTEAGTPRMLTPHHTGLSQRSDTSSRVDEWRKSLSQAGDEQPQVSDYPSPFLHPQSASRPPMYTSDSQGTLESNLSSNRYSVYDGDLRRRASSGSTHSTRTASINIQIEPPSRPGSEGARTPVPDSNRGQHSTGHYAPFNSPAQPINQPGPSSPGYRPPTHIPAGRSNGYGYVPADHRMTPGYLSPNRSPLDLTPSGPEPGDEGPVIPGQAFPRPGSRMGPSTTSIGRNASVNGNGLPFGFVPIHVQPSPGQSQRPIPRDRPTYDDDDDDDGDDTETGSGTSTPRDLMAQLYASSPMSAIPPGVVTGGSPIVNTSTLGSRTPRFAGSSSSSSADRWPPNPPPGPSSPLSNPLPKPPAMISSQSVTWGDATHARPKPYVNFEPPHPPSTAPVNGTPIPIPNPTLRRGAPRVGVMSPSMVAAMDQALPNTNSPGSRTKRASMHAGTTPISAAQPLPSAMKHGRRTSVSSTPASAGKSPLPFSLRTFPTADSVGSRTASGSGSGGGSPADSDSDMDAETQENTLANSRRGGSPYMAPMLMVPGSPYRS